MDGVTFGKAVFKDVRDPMAQLERPIKAGDAGRRSLVQIERVGQGRLYYATRLDYALPTAMDVAANAGIEVHREYSVERAGKWELLQPPVQIKRGELIRVDLYVSIPAARNFVVVDDPVPGGLEPVNRDLATASEVDAKKGDFNAAGGLFGLSIPTGSISALAFGVSTIRKYGMIPCAFIPNTCQPEIIICPIRHRLLRRVHSVY